MNSTISHMSPPRSNVRFDRMMPSYHDRMAQQAAGQGSQPPLEDSFVTLVIKTGIFLVASALLILGAAMFFGGRLASGGYSTDPTPLKITINGDDLLIPANMIRFRNQRANGIHERADLHVHWPSMNGYSNEFADQFNALTNASSQILFLTLEKREMRKDMSGRIALIYNSFLHGPAIDAGNGLVQRDFANDSPYAGEKLLFESGNPHPFATRCMEQNVSDKKRGVCIRDIQIGKRLMLTYRFDQTLLPQWRQLDRSIRQVFNGMVVGQ